MNDSMRGSWLVIGLIVVATTAVVVPPVWEQRGRGPADGRTTLLFTVWGMPFEDRVFEDEYARGYEALMPHIRVDYRRYGDDLLQKYNTWHTLGRGPEVMRLRVTDYHGMVARGMLEPLGPSIEDPESGLSAGDLADLPAHIMQILELDGRVYALPQDNAQFGLFYNREIFDAYNAANPDDPVEYPSPDWTWEDLREAAGKLTVHGPGGRIEVAGFDFAVWAWPFLALFAQAGGELWADEGSTTLINSEPGVRALEFLRTLQREDRSFRVTLGHESPTGPDRLFAVGRTAMLLDGSWRVPALEGAAPELDFAVSALPRGPRDGGRPAVVSGSVLWGISSRAAHKDEAWRMLRWLIAPEQAEVYWDKLRVAPPARLSVVQSEAFRSTSGLKRRDGSWEVPPMPPERFQDRAAWILYANTPHPETGEPPGFVPVGPYQTELEEEIGRMLEAWLNPANTESARAVLDRAARNVHAIIDRDRSARGLPGVTRERWGG
jgi:multiple sugar transport system substrate-binding protein